MPNGSVHWFSILNSLLVVMVMSVIVAVILMRTVRRDLAKYEELLVEGQVRAAALRHTPATLFQNDNCSLFHFHNTCIKAGHRPSVIRLSCTITCR